MGGSCCACKAERSCRLGAGESTVWPYANIPNDKTTDRSNTFIFIVRLLGYGKSFGRAGLTERHPAKARGLSVEHEFKSIGKTPDPLLTRRLLHPKFFWGTPRPI